MCLATPLLGLYLRLFLSPASLDLPRFSGQNEAFGLTSYTSQTMEPYSISPVSGPEVLFVLDGIFQRHVKLSYGALFAEFVYILLYTILY